jgi:hypothetical protein
MSERTLSEHAPGLSTRKLPAPRHLARLLIGIIGKMGYVLILLCGLSSRTTFKIIWVT